MKKYLPISIFSLLAVLLIWQNINQSKWAEKSIIRSDVSIYYTYLPATVINKDPFFKIKDNRYRITVSPNGTQKIKMTMGVAFMDLPFFMIGHLYASYSSMYIADGYSVPYQFMLSFSSVFYTIMGLLLLWLFLKRRFSNWASLITIILIALGTNLYYYAAYETGMSHPCTFFLLSALLYLTPKWLTRKRAWNSLLIGLILGLIILIRPINILFVLPILILLKDQHINWKSHFKNLLLPFSHIVWMVLGGVLILLPQLIFWKIQTGNLLYYSYGGEGFFFLQPHVWKGLFSFRKGWFIYTPLMLFALFGLYRLYKKEKSFFWALVAFLPLFIYVTFSWWNWWYGGSFGARTLIDILPLMTLPLVCLIEWSLKNKYRLTLLLVPAAFVYLNIFQTWQYSKGFIHFESMTWPAYKEMFLKKHTTKKYYDLLQKPDSKNSYKYGIEKHDKASKSNDSSSKE